MKPPLPIRGINVCETLSRHSAAQVHRLLERLPRWKMNTLVVHPQYGFAPHASAIREYCRGHGIRLVQYLYTTLAFASNAPRPLFAVDAEGNPHHEKIQCETRLCAILPRARAHFREGARRYLGEETEPDDEVLLATPDGALLCECGKCRTLNAVEQWQPFLEIAVDEIARSGKALKTHFIAYVGRFRPPRDLSVFEKIDAVMFDTHLRHRWTPLGSSHALGQAEQIEGRHDPEALGMPINIYLHKRLKEWRAAFRGELYVFENLMIQGCFSLPQPNTPAVLEDLASYRELGIDGVVYEAFEPGITAFEEQLGTLARVMHGEPLRHETSPAERLCRTISRAVPVRARVLSYLYEPEAQDEQFLAAFLKTPAQRKLAALLREYLVDPTYARWWKIAGHALEAGDELDWIYIVYRLATYLSEHERPSPLTPLQARLFSTPKPWDFLEGVAAPQSFMRELLETFPAPDSAAFPVSAG